MDPITISLIVTTVVSGISAIVAVFGKYIKKSSCFGGTIEFRSDTATGIPSSANVTPATACESVPRFEITTV